MGKYDDTAEESLAHRATLLKGRAFLTEYVDSYADAVQVEAREVASALGRGSAPSIEGIWTLLIYSGLSVDTLWGIDERGTWTAPGTSDRLGISSAIETGDILRISQFIDESGALKPDVRVPTNFADLYVERGRLVIARRKSVPGVALEEVLRVAIQKLVVGT